MKKLNDRSGSSVQIHEMLPVDLKDGNQYGLCEMTENHSVSSLFMSAALQAIASVSKGDLLELNIIVLAMLKLPSHHLRPDRPRPAPIHLPRQQQMQSLWRELAARSAVCF